MVITETSTRIEVESSSTTEAAVISSLRCDDQPPAPPAPPPRVFHCADMAAWDLLQRPIWVFDPQKYRMWWGNEASWRLWNAVSREEFLARDYATDMSDCVKFRCHELMRRLEQGEVFNEQWTYYPRGQATTMVVGFTGIMITDDAGGPPYLAMVNEGMSTLSTKNDDDVAAEGLRSIEMLRHLPEPVAQFNARDGTLVTQNPEALRLFGRASFVDRFVDAQVGRDLLQAVQGGDNTNKNNAENFSGDTSSSTSKSTSTSNKGAARPPPPPPPPSMQVKQKTLHGDHWFDVQVRCRPDPVTAEPVVLYAARDISVIMESEAKSELLSVIAHEIRTPLHALNGFTELLDRTELDSAQHEYVTMVKQSCMCMMGVINDVLDFGKVESGKLQLESIPFSLPSVASGTIAAITPIAEKKGVEVHTHFDPNLPVKVVGDPSRFRQVLSNLLSNAVKFTDYGKVSVSITMTTAAIETAAPLNSLEHDCSRGSGGTSSDSDRVFVHVSVEDTGIGIKPESQALLFQKYRQVHAPKEFNKYGGTGLGLAISKNLIELMGGTIGVESVVNVGSKFWFCLPFVPATPLLSPLVTTPSNRKQPGAKIARNDQSWNVLVAEDDKVCQKLAAAMLRTLGHTVTVVGDGVLAVDAVLQSGNHDRFDLVLMDVQMPKLNGLEATRQIRNETPDQQALPIIGLTADFIPSEMSKYMAAGMNSCLGKPIRLDALRMCIQDLQSPQNMMLPTLASS